MCGFEPFKLRRITEITQEYPPYRTAPLTQPQVDLKAPVLISPAHPYHVHTNECYPERAPP